MTAIRINDQSCNAGEGDPILAAATANGCYIPALCSHPDLPPFCASSPAHQVFRGPQCFENAAPCTQLDDREGCGLCLVEVEGLTEPVRACRTPVSSGMVIRTASPALLELRRTNLMRVFARHPHACLTCAQREGCSRESCSSNVSKEERCCDKFSYCELRKIADYVGIKEETPRYRPEGRPSLGDEPLYLRNFELCIDCGRCVRVCDQVRGVGALGLVRQDGRFVVGSIAPTLLESGCHFCGACVEVCPTGALMDKIPQTGDRQRHLLPCVQACPAGVDIPGYNRAIAAGDFQTAAAIVWETLPLAHTLGHICFHPCESACRRGLIDEPVAICPLKRFALEAGGEVCFEQVLRPPQTDRHVAVIGGGPAGLSAAYFLRLKGHAVTVLEAEPAAGGMPALSIPDYRLPRSVLEKDIAAIRKLGVEIETGRPLESTAAIPDLLHQGFDSVLVAVGLAQSKKIPIEGDHFDGVLWGLEFLREVKAGRRFPLGRQIVVVGGGNVALDVAMTALRLSGGTVQLFCLESRADMPAHPEEIRKAEEEGVQIHGGWGPTAIHGESGRARFVEFRRCLTVFNPSGQFAPTFDEADRRTVPADAVILAIGQSPREAPPTERNGVFLAGDIAGGPMSVVHAVASGRAAAERIDRYLGGNGQVSVRLVERTPPSDRIAGEAPFAPRPRLPVSVAAPQQRRTSFQPIEQTYPCEQATAEARRCLQCDLRLKITPPPLPPEKWLEFNRANVEQAPPGDGVFVLAAADKKPIVIKGTPGLRAALLEKLASAADARYFSWEEDRMFTKRESELIQQHLERYGQLPGGGDDDLSDLF